MTRIGCSMPPAPLVTRSAFMKSLVMAIGVVWASGLPAHSGESMLAEELATLSVGSFTTIAQARRDPRYGVAEAEIVRIWPERQDGVWLYQEQAYLGDTPSAIDPTRKDRPYFARVIQLVETGPNTVERRVFKLENPASALGAWRHPAPLIDMSPGDLRPSECVMVARRVAEKFWYSESGKCPNDYKAAAYAVSLSVVVDGTYANWDRGFASDGRQVWGPADAGYIFVRKE
ncbi:MAG: hypothetical protein D6763_12285 [Alphaproteobacteria bacterium]|nr:MAG: hypothetical protein D6763_12285 [Alphaproteobacteria bacterium]